MISFSCGRVGNFEEDAGERVYRKRESLGRRVTSNIYIGKSEEPPPQQGGKSKIHWWPGKPFYNASHHHLMYPKFKIYHSFEN